MCLVYMAKNVDFYSWWYSKAFHWLSIKAKGIKQVKYWSPDKKSDNWNCPGQGLWENGNSDTQVKHISK